MEGAGGDGTMGRGGSAGMPSLRFGRGANGKYRSRGGGGDPNGAFNPRTPDKPGMYRPEYKLSDADLNDYVVGTVAGEAVTSNPESVDAVINNMMNRLGTKGWGPSANLHDVASAPGQYAGHRKATAQEAERIRDRIRAIASGGVPDNTNGSNAYRAAWYNGPWARQHAADGRVVGGNRFAFEPGVPNGPYAPYKAPHGTPTVGSSTAPTGPIIGDQAALDAQKRIVAGNGTPADHAIIAKHREQENTPVAPAKPHPNFETKGSDGQVYHTADMRDPRFAPQPKVYHPDDDRASRSRASDVPYGARGHLSPVQFTKGGGDNPLTRLYKDGALKVEVTKPLPGMADLHKAILGHVAKGTLAPHLNHPLGVTPALRASIDNSRKRGDTVLHHSPTFHVAGGDTRTAMDHARLTATRGSADILRNMQVMDS